MTFQTREVEAALRKKGFREGTGGRHKKFTYFRSDGLQTTIFTVMSHGRSGKDIADRLIGMMARQCKVDRKIFTGLVCCNIDQSKYEAELIRRGVLNDITENNA